MFDDPIARMRRFNRAVTTEVGALDSSFLGRGRPLGAARVLCAIPPEGRDVSDLRRYLDLDSGLMSRLLRALEAEGLVATEADPGDGRRRRAVLTEAGRREAATYDRLSNDRAARLLAHHPHPEALLAAMDLVASALGQHRIDIVAADPASAEARWCLGQYYAELARRFPEGFDVGRSLDPDAPAMRPPRGSFLLAMSDGLPVGCVALKGTGGEAGELKRLWVAPPARGLGPAAGGGLRAGGAGPGHDRAAARHQPRAHRGHRALPPHRLARDPGLQRRALRASLVREAPLQHRLTAEIPASAARPARHSWAATRGERP
jgi:DNA-binding MarR family transcriptional regulator